MSYIKSLQRRKLLLDTHVWIWLVVGNTILKPSFRKAIQRCQKYEGILISPISIWEVGMLVEKKRITIEMDRLDWVEQALDCPGIKLVPISPRIAIQSTRLPANSHGDPADRLLISTAHEHNAVLVTSDKKLLEYGKNRYINVHDPTA